MGVRGLSTFVHKNKDNFLRRYQLCNESVVIDGDNLLYRLSRTCRGLNPAFGGDYHKYSLRVEEFFQNLFRCGVTPVVLLDGGSDPSSRKCKTAFKRLRDKLEVTRRLNPVSQERLSCLPLMSKAAFLEVLRHLSVAHAVCEFEADEPLAALARYLDCAVLSDDTDFFAFGVRCVLLSSLAVDAERTDAGQWYLDCVEFRHDRFMQHHGLKPQLMPLFACLLGNDYISPAILTKFFLHVPRPYAERKNRASDKRIRGLLTWLRRHDSSQEALDEVMTQLKKEDRPAVLAVLRRSMANYVQPAGDLLRWLALPETNRAEESDAETRGPSSAKEPREEAVSSDPAAASGSRAAVAGDPAESAGDPAVCAGDPAGAAGDPAVSAGDPAGSAGDPAAAAGGLLLNGRPLPPWLMDAARRGYVTADVINIITCQPLLQEPQAEDPRRESACACVEPLLRWMVGCVHGGRDVAVPLYLRQRGGRGIECRRLRPDPVAPPPPPLADVAALGVERRRAAVLAALGVEWAALEPLPARLQLLAAALAFWRRAAAPVSAAHLGALLLVEWRAAAGVAPLAAAEPELLSGECRPDLRLLHQLAQLQCVLIQAGNVNALLGSPLAAVSPARLLAGPLVYNAARQLRQHGPQRAAAWLSAGRPLDEWRRLLADLCRAAGVTAEFGPFRPAAGPDRGRPGDDGTAPPDDRPPPREDGPDSADESEDDSAEDGLERGEDDSSWPGEDSPRPAGRRRRRRPDPQLSGNKFAALLLDGSDASSDGS